ncbi:MAG TPA: hypothetical protein VEU30_01355, partial [Thermoanaerobaculia bacterium]|nr:hypothetical protein [Thermoanaerobaculia bacterium]
MIHRVTTRVFIAMAIVIAALNAPAEELARRKVFPKPTREIIKAAQYSPHAMLKLVEGSGVRLRGGRLIVDPQSITERLGRNGIDPDQLQPRVAALNTILAKYKATAARQFTREEKELDDYRAAGETATAQELGDQNLFYILTFKAADDEMIEALVELNALDVVEQASPMPKVTNPVVDKPPTTPLLTGGQGYFNAAPQGIGALNMGGIAGGLGQGVTITDVEYNWTPTHEDLKPPLSHHHPNTLPGEHGTAVL